MKRPQTFASFPLHIPLRKSCGYTCRRVGARDLRVRSAQVYDCRISKFTAICRCMLLRWYCEISVLARRMKPDAIS